MAGAPAAGTSFSITVSRNIAMEAQYEPVKSVAVSMLILATTRLPLRGQGIKTNLLSRLSY